MTTQEVANRLVELCRNGKVLEAENELFADNVVSIEPAHSMMPERVEGRDAVLAKGKGFADAIAEVHGGSFSDPLVADKHFSMTMALDATMKDGNRMNMSEVCVYEVDNGKIVKQQFFF